MYVAYVRVQEKHTRAQSLQSVINIKHTSFGEHVDLAEALSDQFPSANSKHVLSTVS